MLQSRRRRRHGQQVMAAPRRGRRAVFAAIAAVALLSFGLWFSIRSFMPLVAGERVATVLETDGRGRVTVHIGDDTEPKRAETGLKLYAGDRASTDGASSAILHFFDGSVVTLAGESAVLLVEAIRGEEQSRLAVTIEAGSIFVKTGTGTAVERIVTMPQAELRVPPHTRAVLGEIVSVFASSGPGIDVAIHPAGGSPVSIVVGEGQMLDLTPGRIAAVHERGDDPYALRGVLDQQVLSSPLVLSVSRREEGPASLASGEQRKEGETVAEGELLVIDVPGDGALIQGSAVLLTGRAGSRVALVRVNGYSALLSDGTFEKEIALPAEEEFTVEIQAEDRDGIVIATKSLSLRHDIKPPDPPAIAEPGGEGKSVLIMADEFEIVGDPPADAVGIIVNGYQLQKFRPGEPWRYLVNPRIGNVVLGENTYEVVAVDRAGNRSEPSSITVVWKAQPLPPLLAEAGGARDEGAYLAPGTLRVTAPAAGERFETGAHEVLIEGETSPDTAAISVNGFTLTKYLPGKTTWNYIAKGEFGNYRTGANRYTIVARNAEGRIVDVLQYVIERQP